MAGTNTQDRVRKHREAMRKAGLRPIQMWVPDTRQPDFAREAARQSKIVREHDEKHPDEAAFWELAASDIEGWE